MIRLALGTFILWGCGQLALAHPLHVSIAEAEFNARTGKLEVAMRVHPAELQAALQRRSDRAVDLHATEQVDPLITQLLQEAVVIQREGSPPLQLSWVDKEVGGKFAWLFFEFRCDNPTGEWMIENRLFHDQLDDQINTITFKQRGSKRSLSFTRNRAQRKLRLPLITAGQPPPRRSSAPASTASPMPRPGADRNSTTGITRKKKLAPPIMSH